MHRALVHLFTNDSPHVTGCIACNNVATHACAKCGIRYCGKQCQSSDWNHGHHSLICSALVGARGKDNLARKYREQLTQRQFERQIKRSTLQNVYANTYRILESNGMEVITHVLVDYLTPQQLIGFAMSPSETWPFFARTQEFWYWAAKKTFPDVIVTAKVEFQPAVDYLAIFHNTLLDRKIKRGDTTLTRYGNLLTVVSDADGQTRIVPLLDKDEYEAAIVSFTSILNREDILGGLQATDPELWNWLSNQNMFWFYYYMSHLFDGSHKVRKWGQGNTRTVRWRLVVLDKYNAL